MSTTRNVLTVDSMDAVEKGMLVALNVENYQFCPLIARIEEVNYDSFDVVWMERSCTRVWKVAKKKEERNLVEWTDTAPRNSVILFHFRLTKSNRLRKATIEHLKATSLLI